MMEKLKTKTDQETKFNTFIGILKGIIAFAVITLSLFHVFFEPKSSLVAANDKEYGEIVNKRKTLNEKYRLALRNGTMGVDEFLLMTEELLTNSKTKIDKLNKEKRQINEDHSFRGRSSFHFWIFVFGLVTALFYFSCKSLFDEFAKGSTFKHHLVSFSGLVVSGFWFIHLIFFTQKDFSKNSYVFVILICALCISSFTYFLVKYYSYKDDIIYKQLSLLERIKTIHYHRIALKAMYAEKNGKPLKEKNFSVGDYIQEFQNDLKETTNNV